MSKNEDGVVEEETISKEVADRIATLPEFRTPTQEEIDWLAKLIEHGIYHHVAVSDMNIVQALIEQNLVVEIVHLRNTGCYAATMKGFGFFTGLYDVETIPQALAAYKRGKK